MNFGNGLVELDVCRDRVLEFICVLFSFRVFFHQAFVSQTLVYLQLDKGKCRKLDMDFIG